jgi:hypothetical protein
MRHGRPLAPIHGTLLFCEDFPLNPESGIWNPEFWIARE